MGRVLVRRVDVMLVGAVGEVVWEEDRIRDEVFLSQEQMKETAL